MTTAMKRHWVYEPGHLWSRLVMFGPSARECWNDSLGCGAGWHPVEIKAWTNVNAFIARVTAQEIADFTLYGMWALDEALVDEINVHENRHQPPPSRDCIADALFQVAAVWIRLAGRRLLHKSQEVVEDEARAFVTPSKWEGWRRMFEKEAESMRYTVSVSQIARDCAQLMSQFEKELMVTEVVV
ncbi:hypothetical protein M406DRAFT_356021 [Cryphonectria parasitica EP155]|uniref:Uncharacterized protein n=1 Tax=Cryphonectria parasitica (strain ATCC 38755 / EP155) TaxID=660469 RepID=A0A9P4Y2A6_CRYP1|nr:uncharacterized protein M406DRAFT_356021 [Cryphonectria parasitica EP155]KAF3765699.1 hypothetical protein M406DRAFT_356021 [Cryphonectria parasitica EP155]